MLDAGALDTLLFRIFLQSDLFFRQHQTSVEGEKNAHWPQGKTFLPSAFSFSQRTCLPLPASLFACCSADEILFLCCCCCNSNKGSAQVYMGGKERETLTPHKATMRRIDEMTVDPDKINIARLNAKVAVKEKRNRGGEDKSETSVHCIHKNTRVLHVDLLDKQLNSCASSKIHTQAQTGKHLKRKREKAGRKREKEKTLIHLVLFAQSVVTHVTGRHKS